MRKGKRLESILDFTHQLYKNQKKADIIKRQIKCVFDKKSNSMRYTKREGFDYEGCVSPSGKSVAIEAKESHRNLYIDKSNSSGLRLHQLEALLFRHELGAYASVIWMTSANEAYLLNAPFLKWFYNDIYGKYPPENVRKMKSIPIDMAKENGCKQIMNNGLIDYIGFLE